MTTKQLTHLSLVLAITLGSASATTSTKSSPSAQQLSTSKQSVMLAREAEPKDPRKEKQPGDDRRKNGPLHARERQPGDDRGKGGHGQDDGKRKDDRGSILRGIV